MSIMITEVYEAFISAGADEQKAKNAAEAISEHRDGIRQLKYLSGGLYIAIGAVGVVLVNMLSVLNTILGKL